MSELRPVREYVFDESYPRDQPTYIPILRPLPHAPVDGVICCPRYEGVLVHWTGSTNILHVQPRVECAGCRALNELRRKYYVGLWLTRCGKFALAELTVGAMQSCPGLAGQQGVLTGLGLKVCRLGASRQGRQVAELYRPLHESELPPPFDVRAAVVAIYTKSNGGMLCP